MENNKVTLIETIKAAVGRNRRTPVGGTEMTAWEQFTSAQADNTVTREIARHAYGWAWQQKDNAEAGVAAGCAHGGLDEFTRASSRDVRENQERLRIIAAFL